VHRGARNIRKRYDLLPVDPRRPACLRVTATGWCVTADGRRASAVALAEGVASGRGFTQFLVIDWRTRKVLNDLLFVGPPRHLDERPPSASSSLCSSSWPSSLTSSSTSSSSSSHWSSDSRRERRSGSEDGAVNANRLVVLRTHLTTVALKLRSPTSSSASTSAAAPRPQRTVNAAVAPPQLQQPIKVNPRQLFIGCVPLYVKYGQLKTLFERFGEVAYVKVYDGFNRSTGAKMTHNYAFLFFKDAASVDLAVAASPIPLDDHWKLNVSRPHQHVANADRDQ